MIDPTYNNYEYHPVLDPDTKQPIGIITSIKEDPLERPPKDEDWHAKHEKAVQKGLELAEQLGHIQDAVKEWEAKYESTREHILTLTNECNAWEAKYHDFKEEHEDHMRTYEEICVMNDKKIKSLKEENEKLWKWVKKMVLADE